MLRFRSAPLALILPFVLAPSVARAQATDVALVTRGARGADAAEAFATFIELPADRRYRETPQPPPEGVGLLVTIDTEVPVVQVWRRRDGVVLERRFARPEAEEAYALALVASELLEVARRGGDPTAVGATVAPAPIDADATPVAIEVTDQTEADAEHETAVDALAETPPDAAEVAARPSDASPPSAVAATLGVAFEGWFSVESDAPWHLQPTLFVELLGRPGGDALLLGGAIQASGLGAFSREEGTVEGRYQRYDVGLRATAGGDVGPLSTRLLGHLRGGASAVIGRGDAEESENDASEAVAAGWFVGLSVEGRQPLWKGLEITLELGADLLPAPVRFTAFGVVLIVESPVRLVGRLGLAWRFE